jgi:hypothetical protein
LDLRSASFGLSGAWIKLRGLRRVVVETVSMECRARSRAHCNTPASCGYHEGAKSAEFQQAITLLPDQRCNVRFERPHTTAGLALALQVGVFRRLGR